MPSKPEISKPHERIEKYFKRHIGFDPETAHHFASRLWLWMGDDWSREVLDANQSSYIGTTELEVEGTINKIIQAFESKGNIVGKRKFRQPYFDKYPKLLLYNRILPKMLFAQALYDLDIRPQIRAHFTDTELLETFHQLYSDQDAIRALSTHASNFFYMLRYYFRDNPEYTDQLLIDPKYLIIVGRGYDDQIARGELDHRTAQDMRTYLLTHAVLGESQFYQRHIENPDYTGLIRELEQIISQDFDNVSIDNKNEFLVCAKLCGQETHLASSILTESIKAISQRSDFIAEPEDNVDASLARALIRAEHRNIMFILANSESRTIS